MLLVANFQPKPIIHDFYTKKAAHLSLICGASLQSIDAPHIEDGYISHQLHLHQQSHKLHLVVF